MRLFRIFVVGFIAVSILGCASIPPQEYYGAEDPFSRQLDHYYIERKSGQHHLYTAALILATSIVATSAMRSGASLGWYDDDIGVAAEIAGYALAAGSSAYGVYGYRRWRDGSEAYIETLRLQSQYYNLIH